jgi:hypothetical protein
MTNLGYALLVRSAGQDEDALRELEEWVTYSPDELAATAQARRRAAAAALGVMVAQP